MDLFNHPDDATPLAPEERDGLKQTWITSRGDLNEAEEENILKAIAWARRRRLPPDELLHDAFARSLHKRMLGDVWDWAGTYRLTERNIGIDSYRISTELASMFNDVRYWVEHKTFIADEIAIRLHHRMVAIHPFPNGNGRHTRLMADLLVERLGGAPFSWGGGSLADVGELRMNYINALRKADNHDLSALLVFARN